MTFAIVYIWARKNPHAIMNFLGIFNFHAPVMPFVLVGVSIVVSGEIPLTDVLGVLAGHVCLIVEELMPHIFGPGNILVPY